MSEFIQRIEDAAQEPIEFRSWNEAKTFLIVECSLTPPETTVLEQEGYGAVGIPFDFSLVAKSTWMVGFSKNFLKDARTIDRKLQGRILKAVFELTQDPLHAVGDTVKPLGGTLKGFWRYRIGDFRLVYRPDEESRSITVVAFAPREDVYS